MDDDETLVAAFEDATLPPSAFGHEEHLRAAWWILRHTPGPAGLSRFADALRRYVARHGAEDKYHDTITWAYLLLLRERIDDGGADAWPAFRAAHADLLAPGCLHRWYRPETLASDRARRGFVFPDAAAPRG